ncbi:Sm-like protein [Drosera capensis]
MKKKVERKPFGKKGKEEEERNAAAAASPLVVWPKKVLLRSREGGKEADHNTIAAFAAAVPIESFVILFESTHSSSRCITMSGRKETVLDLAKFVDKGVQVKLTGGRQVTGTLKGYDQLLNLVLDEAVEYLRDQDDPLKTTDQTRRLGLIVCRGTAVMLVAPTDGTDEIANPFLQSDGA